MVRRQCWCHVTVRGAGGVVIGRFALDGDGDPDLVAVDDVARFALQAARLGGGITLRDVCPAMGALLELAALGIEVEGQAELAEEPGVIDGEEQAHRGDPVT